MKPTVEDLISYYRNIASEAELMATKLESTYGILSIEGEREVEPAAPKRKYTRRKNFLQEAVWSVSADEVRNFLGSSSRRVKEIKNHFNVPAQTIRELITPENRLEMATRGWIRAI